MLFPQCLTPGRSIISVTTYSAILSSPDKQRNKLEGTQAIVASTFFSTAAKILGVFVVLGALFFAYRRFVLKRPVGQGFGDFVGRGGSGPMSAFYNDAKRF